MRKMSVETASELEAKTIALTIFVGRREGSRVCFVDG